MRPFNKKEIEHRAKVMVKHILDLARVSSEVREEIKSEAEVYVTNKLIELTKTKAPKKTEL